MQNSRAQTWQVYILYLGFDSYKNVRLWIFQIANYEHERHKEEN